MEMTRFITGPLEANTWVVMEDSTTAMIVDPAEATPELIDFLADKKLETVDMVITHGHFDHIGGIPKLKALYPQAKIWIHKNDAQYIGKNAGEQHLKDFPELRLHRYVETWPSDFPPATDFLEDGQILHQFKVLHTPGHTRGSVCLWNEEEKVVFTGDTLFHHSFGRTDLCGGDKETLIATMKKLATLPDDCVVHPGHMSSTSIALEKQSRGAFHYFGLS